MSSPSAGRFQALAPTQFLYASAARFVRSEFISNVWVLSYTAPPGVSNRAQSATNPVSEPVWADSTWYTPTAYVSRLVIPLSLAPSLPHDGLLRFTRPRR